MQNDIYTRAHTLIQTFKPAAHTLYWHQWHVLKSYTKCSPAWDSFCLTLSIFLVFLLRSFLIFFYFFLLYFAVVPFILSELSLFSFNLSISLTHFLLSFLLCVCVCAWMYVSPSLLVFLISFRLHPFNFFTNLLNTSRLHATKHRPQASFALCVCCVFHGQIFKLPKRHKTSIACIYNTLPLPHFCVLKCVYKYYRNTIRIKINLNGQKMQVTLQFEMGTQIVQTLCELITTWLS